MGRGKPAFWSSLVSIPFVLLGLWFYFGDTPAPEGVGLPFVAFGVFVLIVGLYVHVVSPSQPRLGENEQILSTAHPAQRVARVKIGLGFVFLAVTIYLFYFTGVPYIYPTLAFVVGLYTFSTGIHTFWTNSLTTYYVTTNRVIKEYRFLSLVRQEVPREKIRGVQERKSIIETLVGLGNVQVASGGGRALVINMRNMEQSGAFADEIRRIISS